MVDLHPTKCNICQGRVIYTSNATIYGRQYGSGYCYYCTECGAYVGTHEPRPKEAMGLLADREMREMKIKCHELFDSFWKTLKTGRGKMRRSLYQRLANQMHLSIGDCHFGYFGSEELNIAYIILQSWEEREINAS